MRLNTVRANWAAVALALCCCALEPPQAQAQETGMGPSPYYSTFVKGNFVVAGDSTRMFMGPPQTDPFTVALAGIPNGATIVKAFANWSFMTDNPGSGLESTIIVNGNAVFGSLTGKGSPDLGWGYGFGAAYTADITNLVQATGNGNYTIMGATDNNNDGAIGEGISLLAVYSDPNATTTNKVMVYNGYTSTSSGNATANYDFGGKYMGGPAHFFINALDGQDFLTDDFFINGVNRSNMVPGGVVGNAWQGKINGEMNAMYDQLNLNDIGGPGNGFTNVGLGYINLNDGFLTAQTQGAGNDPDPATNNYSDFVGHSFGALAIPTIPEPSAVSTFFACLSGGLLCCHRRRRTPRH